MDIVHRVVFFPFFCFSAALIMMMVTVWEWMTTLCILNTKKGNTSHPTKQLHLCVRHFAAAALDSFEVTWAKGYGRDLSTGIQPRWRFFQTRWKVQYLGSETRFQIQNSASFWFHGRISERMIWFFALNMTWTRCEVCWTLDFEPFEKEGLSVFGLKAIFCHRFWCKFICATTSNAASGLAFATTWTEPRFGNLARFSAFFASLSQDMLRWLQRFTFHFSLRAIPSKRCLSRKRHHQHCVSASL